MPAAPTRQALSAARVSLTAALAGIATTLQGCGLDISAHPAAAWESQPSYLLNFQFVPNFQGKVYNPQAQAVLNSCRVPGLAPWQQCNGHGTCIPWNLTSSAPPIYFCECDRDWADPECRTRRKSQVTAFFLSLFGGFFGLDRFYLGDYVSGLVKLCSFGGLGLWWVYDIARTGSGPIYTKQQYRLAMDLPHWVYVFVSVGFFAALGWWFFVVWGPIFERRRRIAKMLVEAEEEFFQNNRHATDIRPEDRESMLKGPIRRSLQVPLPGNVFGYGSLVDAPPQVKFVSDGNPLATYNSWLASAQNPVVAADVTATPPPWYPAAKLHQAELQGLGPGGAGLPPTGPPTGPGQRFG